MKISIRKRILILSIFILSVNGLIGYAVYLNYQRFYHSEEWVKHTEQVIFLSGNILSLAKDIQSASWGYVVTGDSTFLRPLWTTTKTISLSISQLKRLVSDNDAQVRRVDSLEFYIDKRMNHSLTTVELRSKKGLSAAIANVSTKQGTEYAVRIENITIAIQQEEAKLLEHRKHTNKLIISFISLFSAIMFILMEAFTVLWLRTTRNYLLQSKEKEKRAAELVIANEELGFQNSEKEKIAAELLKANRLYSFISQINQAIVKASDEDTLFKKACNIAIENGKFELAFISKPDVINRKVNIVVHYNATEYDLKHFDNLVYNDDGPTAQVLRNGKPYVINDYEQETAIGGSKKYASDRGFKSCILLPIKKAGKTTGVYNLFSDQLNLFDEQEIALLDEASENISFALDVFEKEKSRKQMEDKVMHSELQMKRAQAIAHFGSWELGLSTGIVEWSEEACRIYGLECEDNSRSYQSWTEFIHPDDLDEVMAVARESALNLKSTELNYRIIRKDGAIRHIFSQTQFKLDEDGEPVLLNCVTHDITDMKEAEAERTVMMADIVKRNKNLEQFSYAVSHNLRSPVANILGIADAMQTIELTKEDEAQFLDYLANAVKKLDTVVFDLNEILKIKHEVSEQKNMVCFSTIVSDVKQSIGNVIRDSGAKIICDFSEVDEMLTLKSYLYSIFFNLISNSIKYHQPGIAPEIKITSTIGKNKVQILFEDNGLGIDLTKSSEEVFGIYKRFHDHVEGKGLGLYMVKTQVETLGGTIAIESVVNKGTKFVIEFDLND